MYLYIRTRTHIHTHTKGPSNCVPHTNESLTKLKPRCPMKYKTDNVKIGPDVQRNKTVNVTIGYLSTKRLTAEEVFKA